MQTNFSINEIVVSFDSTQKKFWEGEAPGQYMKWGYGINKSEYFEASILHPTFEVTLYVIYWNDYGIYEISPNIRKGNEALQSLKYRLRLTAKKEVIQQKEYFVSQLRIAKLKKGPTIHSNLFDTTEKELSSICKLDIKKFLFDNCKCSIRIKRDIDGDAGPKRNKQYAVFEENNFKALVSLHIFTRLLPMYHQISI